MSIVFAPSHHRNNAPLDTATIQKMLDENAQMIHAIVDYQQKGKVQDAAQLQGMLHRNLVYLATVADQSTSNQGATPTMPQQGGGYMLQQQSLQQPLQQQSQPLQQQTPQQQPQQAPQQQQQIQQQTQQQQQIQQQQQQSQQQQQMQQQQQQQQQQTGQQQLPALQPQAQQPQQQIQPQQAQQQQSPQQQPLESTSPAQGAMHLSTSAQQQQDQQPPQQPPQEQQQPLQDQSQEQRRVPPATSMASGLRQPGPYANVPVSGGVPAMAPTSGQPLNGSFGPAGQVQPQPQYQMGMHSYTGPGYQHPAPGAAGPYPVPPQPGMVGVRPQGGPYPGQGVMGGPNSAPYSQAHAQMPSGNAVQMSAMAPPPASSGQPQSRTPEAAGATGGTNGGVKMT